MSSAEDARTRGSRRVVEEGEVTLFKKELTKQ